MMLIMAPKPGQGNGQLDRIHPIESCRKSTATRRQNFKASKQVSFEKPCEFEELCDKVGKVTLEA